MFDEAPPARAVELADEGFTGLPGVPVDPACSCKL